MYLWSDCLISLLCVCIYIINEGIVLNLGEKMSRPVFCGNFEYETRQSDLERLFSKYGRVERVDMKSGIFILSFNYAASAMHLDIFFDCFYVILLVWFMCLNDAVGYSEF